MSEEPVGPTGAPLFTCPSDQNKCRALHPSASVLEQTNKLKGEHNTICWSGGRAEDRGLKD